MRIVRGFILAAFVAVAGCASTGSTTPTTNTPTLNKPTTPTITYTCKVCSGSYSEAGKCSKCGVPLVPK